MIKCSIKIFNMHLHLISPIAQKYLYHKSVAVSSLTQKEKFEATASQQVTQSCHTFISFTPLPRTVQHCFQHRNRAGDSPFRELAKQKHF